MKRLSIKTWCILGALSVVPVLLMIVLMTSWPFERISEEEVNATRSACSELSLPKSFKKVRETKMVKWETAYFGTTYSSDEDPEAVKNHFLTTLQAQNWNSRIVEDAGLVRLLFEKEKISLAIEYYPSTFMSPETEYSVGCSFGLIYLERDL
ncbi:MAG: hypothetical protein IPM25_13240 [Chloracidobacterium sp.]|nr:hypothetical protein [Chloracidobacterium sp.]